MPRNHQPLKKVMLLTNARALQLFQETLTHKRLTTLLQTAEPATNDEMEKNEHAIKFLQTIEQSLDFSWARCKAERKSTTSDIHKSRDRITSTVDDILWQQKYERRTNIYE